MTLKNVMLAINLRQLTIYVINECPNHAFKDTFKDIHLALKETMKLMKT